MEANKTCQRLDDISLGIAGRMAPMLSMSKTALALRADLPVAYTSQIGMFDIAHYHNELAGKVPPAEGADTDEVNCVPHYDPGLFSLSFYSDAEGLQMFDPTTNKWYAGPINSIPHQAQYGVLWLGKAAEKVSGGKWKPGVHRVIYPAKVGSRLTMWYACARRQILERKIHRALVCH